jgi:hypothetical protein
MVLEAFLNARFDDDADNRPAGCANCMSWNVTHSQSKEMRNEQPRLINADNRVRFPRQAQDGAGRGGRNMCREL